MIIAIDPDVKKSGVAFFQYNKIDCINLDLPDLFLFILENKDNLTVHIEASWLISFDYSSKKMMVLNKSTVASLNRDVGANHEIGRQIEKFCQKNKVKSFLVMPLSKRWGKTGREKISHEEIMLLSKINKYGFPRKQTNQETRDALLILTTII
jgi:hypothetical protein